jgi:hypothetical protein
MLRRRQPILLPLSLLAVVPAATVLLASTAIVLGEDCSPGAAGAMASKMAARTIPAYLLTIYQEVGDQYDLPWQLLAGIGQEECDQGRNPDPSCQPIPGARGLGAANFAGASGPMQIGVGGPAGEAYEQLRNDLPDPRLGPHDPTTAVELAALALIKDKRAARGRPLGAYAAAVAAYNGTGPAAELYAQRVLTDASSYATGTLSDGAGTCQPTQVALVPGKRAKILPDGQAEAPADAPPAVQAMIAAGNRIDHFPYSYGGGHGDPAQTMSQAVPDPAAAPGEQENGASGYDCSSATDYILYGGGFGRTLLSGQVPASTPLESVGAPGPGRWVTIYANPSHAYIEVAGIYLDTAAGEGRPPNPPATGPRWSPDGTGPQGFVARHPPGL